MNKKITKILSLLITLTLVSRCTAQEKPVAINYFGQEPPGITPQLFAPELFNEESGYHGTIIFSPDGKESYWTPMSGGWGKLQFSAFKDSRWNSPTSLDFGLSSEVSEPSLSPDGQRIFFLSTEPVHGESKKRRRIWYCDKTSQGWSKAQLIDKSVYQHPTHWSFSIAENGNIYFTSELNSSRPEIHMAKYEEGSYGEPISLGDSINSEFYTSTPFVAPDESYLLFSRGGVKVNSDIFISRRKPDGSWSIAKNLGPEINSDSQDLGPKVTPDGKYLFFLSSRTGKFRFHWVKADFIFEIVSNR